MRQLDCLAGLAFIDDAKWLGFKTNRQNHSKPVFGTQLVE